MFVSFDDRHMQALFDVGTDKHCFEWLKDKICELGLKNVLQDN